MPSYLRSFKGKTYHSHILYIMTQKKMEIDKETYEGILPCLKDSDVQHLVVNMKTNYMRWRM